MGLVAHLAEVDGAVFSADVLFALIVRRLGLRRDRLACQAEQETSCQFPHNIIIITILLSHTKTKVSSEWLEGTVTFSEKYDTTVDPFVAGAVP